GWEGVGLCSYLLIGFWFNEEVNANAGRKAFIMNRIGDFGFMVAMFMIFWSTGSLDFGAVFTHAPTALVPGGGAITAITLFLFLGCTGKSAQIPLYTWLPDAMAGPTPVSALIHAATMVTAGVYLVARCNLLFAMAPVSSAVVAGVGALTALFAATIALKQWDIKKVLAYSTISQLGYMFLGVGTGAISAGIFHLVTHAFFKALLILGVLSAVGGVLNVPELFRGNARLDRWLEPVVPPFSPHYGLSDSTEWLLVGVAVAVAILGIVGAWQLLKPQALVPARSAPEERGFARLLRNKWYVDEIYDALIVRPLVWLSREVLWKQVDQRAIDGAAVNGAARGARALGWANRWLQTGQVGMYVAVFVVGVLLLLWRAMS